MAVRGVRVVWLEGLGIGGVIMEVFLEIKSGAIIRCNPVMLPVEPREAVIVEVEKVISRINI